MKLKEKVAIVRATEYISEREFISLNKDATEVMKLVRSSILTKKKNLKLR